MFNNVTAPLISLAENCLSVAGYTELKAAADALSAQLAAYIAALPS